jgi:hypothetical protein
MAREIPTDIPVSTGLVQGDYWQWTKSLADYPSNDGWALTYYLTTRANSTNKQFFNAANSGRTIVKKSISASADGSGGYTIAVTAVTSAAYIPGRWKWEARVVKAATSEAYTVESGEIDIAPSLYSQTDAATDDRTFAEYMVEECKRARLLLVQKQVKSYTIGDRTFSTNTLDELAKEQARWANAVAREKGAGPQVALIRFRGVGL